MKKENVRWRERQVYNSYVYGTHKARYSTYLDIKGKIICERDQGWMDSLDEKRRWRKPSGEKRFARGKRRGVPIFGGHTRFSSLASRTRTCAPGACWIHQYTRIRPIMKHMRVSARREGRGCRIAGRGLVFTLISHRVSCGCQTLRPPPCGAPSFHRIRASRVPIPSLLFLSCISFFFFSLVYAKFLVHEGDFTYQIVSTDRAAWERLPSYVCHNICKAVLSYDRACSLYFCKENWKKKKEKIYRF